MYIDYIRLVCTIDKLIDKTMRQPRLTLQCRVAAQLQDHIHVDPVSSVTPEIESVQREMTE